MQLRYNAAILFTVGTLAFAALAQQPKAGTSEVSPSVTPEMPSIQTGRVFVPDSSKPAPAGFAHTNFVIRSEDGSKPSGLEGPADAPIANPDGTIELAETPCSLGHLYVNSPATACIPSFTATGGPAAAGSGAIAIVDAFDNPDAASDLSTFTSHFGLPAANFTKIYATGNGSCKTVPTNTGWALEESLDIEWSHVFAPSAAIVLVEACSNSTADLIYAEQVAFEYIVAHYPTGGQVSNSWQGGEFSGQIADDSYFRDSTYSYTVPIQAFASSGDSGYGVGWPSTDPWVVSAGGTSVLRNSSGDAVTSESCWSGSGGGESSIETYVTSFTGGNMGPWANYQYPIYGQSNRRTPDLSFDADPSSGVYVYSKFYGGWFVVGGTSVSSPSLAGIVNRSQNRLGTVHLNAITGNNAYFAANENNLLYGELPGNLTSKQLFYDVTTGSNGSAAVAGYDTCTGVGTPRGTVGK